MMLGTFRVRAREKYAPSKLLITFAHPNELSVGVSEVLECVLAISYRPGGCRNCAGFIVTCQEMP